MDMSPWIHAGLKSVIRNAFNIAKNIYVREIQVFSFDRKMLSSTLYVNCDVFQKSKELFGVITYFLLISIKYRIF